MNTKSIFYQIMVGSTIILLSCNSQSDNSSSVPKQDTANSKLLDTANKTIKQVVAVDKTQLTPQEVGSTTGDQPAFDYQWKGKTIASDMGEANGNLWMKFNGKRVKLKFNKKLSSLTKGVFENIDYKIEILLSKPYSDGESVNDRDHKIKIYYKNDSLICPVQANNEGPWSIFNN